MSGDDKNKVTGVLKWAGVTALVLGACFTIWSATLDVPVIKLDVKHHETRLTTIEAYIVANEKRQDRMENKIDRLLARGER